MFRRSVSVVVICASLLFSAPNLALAYPFGGQTSLVLPCFNVAILTLIGPPNAGFYLWTPSTQTYSSGPPTRGGQWLLGLTSIPYICLLWVAPIIVWPGIAISMMGSSGSPPPAPVYNPPVGGGGTFGGGGAGGDFTLPPNSQ